MTDGQVSIEIEYDEGSVAHWVLDANDPRIEEIEKILGNPDTLKC